MTSLLSLFTTQPYHWLQRSTSQRGASLVEFVVIVPTLLMMILGVIQTGLVFHAKSNVNYATFEAARAGTVEHGKVDAMRAAFTRAIVGYYGGGRNTKEIAQSTEKALADITPATMQVELLSPTKESFDDYASPRLAAQLDVKARVIPNNNLNAITCPIDRPGCNSNPQSNASGQTLSDANILRIKITYGIPAAKQIPLVGRLYVMVLRGLTDLGLAADADPFKQALLAQGRIPVVVHTTMRMQSAAYENGNISSPGPGNNGQPTPPETGEEDNPPTDNGTCPDSDPNCNDGGDEICNPQEDLFGCRPPACKKGDPNCDPACENGSCSVCTQDGEMANP